MKLDVDRRSSALNDQLKKAKLNEISQRLEMDKQAAVQQQRALMEKKLAAQKLASEEGLSREEIFELDPKVQSRAVFFSDGKARIAVDAQSAKNIRTEILPSAQTALRGINRLQELADEFAGGSLSLEARAEAQTIQQALKGALRLELFGPGVMTDTEQKLADKIIGNPAKLTTLSSIEKKKLETLEDKIVQGTRDRLKISGINLPPTKNERKLEILMKRNPKLSKAQAINALIQTNRWEKEESPF